MKKAILFLMLLCTSFIMMAQRPFGGVATRDTVTQAKDYTYTVLSDAGNSPQIYATSFFFDEVSGSFGGKIYVSRSFDNTNWYPIDTIAVAGALTDTRAIADWTTCNYANGYWGLATKYYKFVVNSDSVGKFVVSGHHSAYKLPAR